VGLIDSAGGRIQEGSGAYSLIFVEKMEASGVIPQISAILGNCAGGGLYWPALTDFIFMVDKTSQMFITGPLGIKEGTGQEVGSQELGGGRFHGSMSGVADQKPGDAGGEKSYPSRKETRQYPLVDAQASGCRGRSDGPS
jgi:acetyl-CoA carboxylase carboxyltransferase component